MIRNSDKHAPRPYPGSARCVQSFDDSLDSASRKTYRISLRSSSLWEPRHPSLKVFFVSIWTQRAAPAPDQVSCLVFLTLVGCVRGLTRQTRLVYRHAFFLCSFCSLFVLFVVRFVPFLSSSLYLLLFFSFPSPDEVPLNGNDPSAGSPTETLLRLHLPLNVEV